MPSPRASDIPSDAPAQLRAAIGRVSRNLRPTLAGSGQSPTRISVLFTIVRRGPLRLSELAEIEGLNPTMLSRVIGKLSDDGLVSRRPDPDDGRAALVQATDAGRRMREKINRERNVALGVELERLEADERRALIEALPALERLAEHLKESHR